MSTEAIRALILRYREALGDDVLPGQADAIRGATDEVEALEKAAVFMLNVKTRGASLTPESMEQAGEVYELFQDIAVQVAGRKRS
jgi:hypothetical protein